MRKDLFIDIETYSSVDIKSCGAYKYIESPDFEILIVGYAFDDEDVVVIDLAQGDELPEAVYVKFLMYSTSVQLLKLILLSLVNGAISK